MFKLIKIYSQLIYLLYSCRIQEPYTALIPIMLFLTNMLLFFSVLVFIFLLRIFWVSWIWRIISIINLQKFSTSICSNISSFPTALSPSKITWMIDYITMFLNSLLLFPFPLYISVIQSEAFLQIYLPVHQWSL